MVYHLTYSTSIFESLGVLSSFNIAETIWDKYEKFAIEKIKETTLKIRGSLYYLKDFTPSEAIKEANAIKHLMPVLNNLKSFIEPINDKAFKDFREAALEFFDNVDFLYFNLEDLANSDSSYELSIPVLATDWDSNEDEHWNNY